MSSGEPSVENVHTQLKYRTSPQAVVRICGCCGAVGVGDSGVGIYCSGMGGGGTGVGVGGTGVGVGGTGVGVGGGGVGVGVGGMGVGVLVGVGTKDVVGIGASTTPETAVSLPPPVATTTATAASSPSSQTVPTAGPFHHHESDQKRRQALTKPRRKDGSPLCQTLPVFSGLCAWAGRVSTEGRTARRRASGVSGPQRGRL